jgi:hypothetical protein
MKNTFDPEITRATGSGNASTKANRVKWILMFGLIAALLGGAAFTAGHLFGRELPVTENPDQGMIKSEDGTIAGSGVRLLPDKRLPDRPPVTSGQFDSLKDNSLFIHQFPTTGMVVIAEMDEYPLVEILVSKDTLIYKDVTDLSSVNHGGVVQQVLTVGSIEEIPNDSSIIVWGEKRGDRVIAEVIQYF